MDRVRVEVTTVTRLRHITSDRLDEIESLLESIRALQVLVERKWGVFYRKSRAFLHFHEDGDDVYADVKLSSDLFDRYRVTTAREQQELLADIRKVL